MKDRDFRRSAPFVLVLFPFMFGVAFVSSFTLRLWELVIIQCFLVGLLWMYLRIVPTSVKYRLRFLHTGAVLAMIGVLGMLVMSARAVSVPDYLHEGGEAESLVIDLYKIRSGSKTNSAFGEVVYTNESGIIRSGDKLLIRFKKQHSSLHVGTRIAVKSIPAPLPPKPNPYEFSYSKYLQNKGVVGILYLNTRNHCIISVEPSRWQAFDSMIKIYVLETLNSFYSQEDAALLSALILGDKTSIETSVKHRFAQTGIMHVLAVSGLHAGIVFMACLGVFRPLLHRRSAILGALIVVWLFAGITGFTPSVSRACFMISVLYGGQIFHRQTSGINSLAFAAFVLLTIQPRWIADIGFQLSCSALAGILILQPFFKSICAAWTLVPDKLIDLVTVSLAAQLGTLPLSLFYFHQFPTYFLVANLIVVPFIPVVLVLGFLTLLFPGVPMLQELIAWLNHCYLWFIDLVTVWISRWPFASFNEIRLNNLQLVFAVVILTLVYFMISKHKWMPIQLAIVMCLYAILLPIYNWADTSVADFTHQAFATQLMIGDNPDKVVGKSISTEDNWATCQVGSLSVTNWPRLSKVEPQDSLYNVAWVTRLNNTSWGKLSKYDLVYVDRSMPFYKLAPYIRWCKFNSFPAEFVYGDYYSISPSKTRMNRRIFRGKHSD